MDTAMELVDAALKSLKNNLGRLGAQFRGSEEEAAGLFRTRLALYEIEARVAQARANGTIDHGRGENLVPALSEAALRVAAAPVTGGVAFNRAINAASTALTDVRDRLSASA